MEKQRWEESERRRKEVRRGEKIKNEKKEDAGARKGKKAAIHCVFPMICVSGGSKSRLAKAAGAEPAGQMRDETLHAVVARSTFPSEHAQNTTCSDHFWTSRCRKSVRRCGVTRISSIERAGRVPRFHSEGAKTRRREKPPAASQHRKDAQTRGDPSSGVAAS